MKRTIFAAIACVVIPAVALANSHPNLERGLVPESMMRMTGPDAINLFNGNLSISVPLSQTYPVSDTLSYSFALRYNSNVWDFLERWDPSDGVNLVQAHPAFFSNAGLGWSVSFGDLLPPGDPFFTGNPAFAWVYLAPDGSRHRFYSSLHEAEAPRGGLYTRDGSYLRLSFVGFDVDENPNKIEIEMPSGNVHTFELGAYDRWRLTRIEDRFGNFVSIHYSYPLKKEGMIWTITDSTNPDLENPRTHRLDFLRYDITSLVPRYRLTKMSLAAFDDSQACYNFEYAEETIPRSYKHEDGVMGYYVTVPLLQGVTFPDGTTDSCGFGGCSGCSTTDFTYNLTGDPAGLVETMRLPTGGVIDWQYGFYTFPS